MRGGRLLDGMKDDPLAKEIFKKMSPMLLLLSEIIQFVKAKNGITLPDDLPAILPYTEMIFGSRQEQIQYCSLVYLFVQTVIAINKVELLPGAWVGSPNPSPLTHTNLQVGPDWKWGGDVDCDTDLDGVDVAAKKGKLFLSTWNTTAGVNQGRRGALTEADDTLKWIWAVDEEGGDYCYWTFKKEGADWVLNDLSIVRPDIFDTGGYKKEAATQVPPIGGDLGTDDNLAPGADEEWVVRYSHRRWREIYPKWIFDTNNAVDAAKITDWSSKSSVYMQEKGVEGLVAMEDLNNKINEWLGAKFTAGGKFRDGVQPAENFKNTDFGDAIRTKWQAINTEAQNAIAKEQAADAGFDAKMDEINTIMAPSGEGAIAEWTSEAFMTKAHNLAQAAATADVDDPTLEQSAALEMYDVPMQYTVEVYNKLELKKAMQPVDWTSTSEQKEDTFDGRGGRRSRWPINQGGGTGQGGGADQGGDTGQGSGAGDGSLPLRLYTHSAGAGYMEETKVRTWLISVGKDGKLNSGRFVGDLYNYIVRGWPQHSVVEPQPLYDYYKKFMKNLYEGGSKRHSRKRRRRKGRHTRQKQRKRRRKTRKRRRRRRKYHTRRG